MNSFFKACLKEAFDLYATGKAIVTKASFAALLPLLIQDGEDAPAIVSNFADFKPELQALLTNPAADADLLAYATSLVGGESAKAQALIAATADLVLSTAEKTAALAKVLQS